MPFRSEAADDSYKIIIEYDIGRKYSHLIKEISKYMLEVAFETKLHCNVTDNAVIIKFDKKLFIF